MPPKIITLLTDFGSKDNYLAAVNAVILTINPNVIFVDITHEITPQNLWEAAFQLGTAAHHFPAGTIHLAIVDPGVGTSRRPLLLQTPHGTFIGPDNGIFTIALNKGRFYSQEDSSSNTAHTQTVPNEYHAYQLTNLKYWRHPISNTFHGRDIFGPVAGHLSAGVPVKALGVKVNSIRSLRLPNLIRTDHIIVGEVIHVAQFGNLITNIPEEDLLHKNLLIKIGQHTIPHINHTYADQKGIQAMIGSYGLLEIAMYSDSAEQVLGLSTNSQVEVKFNK